MRELIDTIFRYANGLYLYRWHGLAGAWVVCTLGWLAVYGLPSVYEAKARFYVDASSRLREVVTNLGMEPDVSSRVFLVRQAMLGRPQLEKVARETDMDLRASSVEELEQLIDQLILNVSIQTGSRKEAQNLFEIAYRDKERKTALAVVDALLNTFLEDVLSEKDADTERTESFLKEQLGYYRNLLENTERGLEDFKKQHAGFVVGDRGDYFERVETEKRSQNELQSQLQVVRGKIAELRRQLSQVSPYVPDGGDSSLILIPGSETSARINELEKIKRDLLLRVTERHPDVAAIVEQIDQLRLQLKGELRTEVGESIDGARSATNPVYVEIQIALSNANVNAKEIEGELGQVSRRLETFQSQVDRAPELERQFLQLTRDYSNYQALYAEVLEQTERERIGRVGDEKDIISFNIIDPPAVGFEAVSPKRGILLFGVFMLGLGSAVGLAFLLWQLKPTYSDESELMTDTGMSSLGTISMNFRHIGRSRRTQIFNFALGCICLLGAFILVMVFQEAGSELFRTILPGGSAF